VPQAEARLKEAAKLGFKTAFVPKGTKVIGDLADGAGLALVEMGDVAELLRFAPAPRAAKSAKIGS
jgi:predicted ATP-dependent serine protease